MGSQSAGKFLILLALLLLMSTIGVAADPKEGFVVAEDGAKLYYQQWGGGSQTVIIPGRFMLGESFSKLARGRTVIMYDMRDRGGSSAIKDVNRLTTQDDVRDLEAVRKHFNAQKFSTVAHGHMGKVVLLYAASYPGHLERVVQLGPAPLRWETQLSAENSDGIEQQIDPKGWSELQQMRKSGYMNSHPREYCEKEWMVTRVRLVGNPANANKLGPGPCTYENEWPTTLAQNYFIRYQSNKLANLTTAQLASIKFPVLTIHGSKDLNSPPIAGRQWAEKLPNARLIEIAGAGRYCWIDEPRTINWIDQFLSGTIPANAKVVRPAAKR